MSFSIKGALAAIAFVSIVSSITFGASHYIESTGYFALAILLIQILVEQLPVKKEP